MKTASAFAGSAALAALMLVAAPVLPSSPVATPAAARTSVSFNVFFDGLEPYGSWVDYRGDYVFVPRVRHRHWRPYILGHWVFAADYGWIWVSDEPFGWATYHYGRWGYASDIGWYWVPGTRWAPAWVTWRRGHGHVVWAPLPPRGSDLSIDIAVGDIPDYYWVAVPTASFLNINLSVDIIDNDRDRRRIVADTDPVGSVRVRNDIVVNNAIDVKVIEQETGKQVKQVSVKETDQPRQAKASDGEVTAFKGEITRDKKLRPNKVTDAKNLKNRAIEENTNQQATDGQTTQQSPDNQAQPAKDKKKSNAQQPMTGQDQSGQDQQAQPTKKEKRKSQQPAAGQDQSGQDQQAQPTKKEKRKAQQPASQQEMQPSEDQGQPAGKDKRKTNEPAANGQGQAPDQQTQPSRKKGGNNKNAPCDPATDPECQAQ